MDTRKVNDEFENILSCSGTLEIFYQPVSIGCGHVFEREFIEDCLGEKDSAPCPECRTYFNKRQFRREFQIEKTVNFFLEKNPDYKKEQYFPVRYLSRLIQENKTKEIIELLKAHEEKINEPLGSNGFTIAHMMIHANKYKMLLDLFTAFAGKLDVNAKIISPTSLNGSTLLNYATAVSKNVDIVRLLLNNGADPKIARKDGATALLNCIIEKKTKMLALLLQSKKDLNPNLRIRTNSRSSTALTAGVLSLPDDEFAQLLALPNIQINLTNNQNETPLYIAAKLGDSNKVKLLLKMPDIDVESSKHLSNGEKITAEMVALREGNYDTASCFSLPFAKLALAKYKLKHNEFTEAEKILAKVYFGTDNESFNTFIKNLKEHEYRIIAQPLFSKIMPGIVLKNDIELLKILNKYINIESYDASNLTLLHYAVIHNNLAILQFLLDNYPNMDINSESKGELKNPPLFNALQKSHQKVANYLLDKGAKLLNSKGKSAILLAAVSRNDEFIKKALMLDQCLYPDVSIRETSGRTELYAITEYCKAETLALYVKRKKDYLGDINYKVGEETALIAAIQINNFEKVKILCELPGLDLNVKCNNQNVLQMAIKCSPPINGFISAYFLLESLLKQKPIADEIKLDNVFAVDEQDMQLIATMLIERGYSKDKVEYLHRFFNQVKNTDVKSFVVYKNSFFRQQDSHEVKMLNALFKFAHQTYYHNSNDWEYKIRREAEQEIMDEAGNQPLAEEAKWLTQIRSEPILAKPRFFLTLGPTKAQQRIDQLLSASDVSEKKCCR